jgi:hypothetical protein
MKKNVFIIADHGLSLIYFLQSDVVPHLIRKGMKVILFTDDQLQGKIAEKFKQKGLIVEGLRIPQCRAYYDCKSHGVQYWLHFLRWVGGSHKVNTTAIDSHLKQLIYETRGGGKLGMPILKMAVWILRRSAPARKWLLDQESRFTPQIYSDLFDKYQPGMIVASTPGWRFDRYMLREAHEKGIRTASVIVGWDNPSSYRLSGAKVDFITCWSELQKEELISGADWRSDQIAITGIPSYDGYFQKSWLIPRDEYFSFHHLDPNRKLLSYACSFVTFSPNYPNVEALVRLVESGRLKKPCQLLIRLHPNHFIANSLFETEANQIRSLIKDIPYVHLVEPVPLGGELGYYSGEDMPEKSSMMAYSDVFLTVYSTMVVETAIHQRPIISVCIDSPKGWNVPGKFSLPLTKIGEWPTHLRFRQSGAGKIVNDEISLYNALNAYLLNPNEDDVMRERFVKDEVTFTDGSSGKRTADYLLGVMKDFYPTDQLQ